jgi:hypothetical protein
MKRNVEEELEDDTTGETILMSKRLRYQNAEELLEQNQDVLDGGEDMESATIFPGDIFLAESNSTNGHEKKFNLYEIFHHSNEKKMASNAAQIVTSVCRTCNSSIDEEEAMVMISCQFCSHIGCSHCTPQCFCCGDRFCKNCSLQNYDSSFERTICIDCNCWYSSSKWSA